MAIIDPPANKLKPSQPQQYQPLAAPKKGNYAVKPVNVNNNMTVQGQMSGLLADNSKYMQQARHRANLASAQKGLLNSSMAVQAGEQAAIASALPIAQQDAQTNFNAAQFNANADNTFNQMRLQDDLSRGRDTHLANLQLAQTAVDHDFQASESKLGREHDAAMQESDQSFRAGESKLGREHDITMQESDQGFRASESLLGRQHQTSEREGAQQFQAGESALGREHQTAMQDDQQAFAASESLLGRQHQSTMQSADHQQQTALQDDAQSHQTEQNKLNREHDLTLQDDQQTHQTALQAAEYEQQTALQNDTQAFEKELATLNHENSKELITENLNADLTKHRIEVSSALQGQLTQDYARLLEGAQREVTAIQQSQMNQADKAAAIVDVYKRLTENKAWTYSQYAELPGMVGQHDFNEPMDWSAWEDGEQPTAEAEQPTAEAEKLQEAEGILSTAEADRLAAAEEERLKAEAAEAARLKAEEEQRKKEEHAEMIREWLARRRRNRR